MFGKLPLGEQFVVLSYVFYEFILLIMHKTPNSMPLLFV
jgi:hypothetical protein